MGIGRILDLVNALLNSNNFNKNSITTKINQTMEDSRLSIVSNGDSELDLLREKLKHKETLLTEKSEIISSLRQQVSDLHHDIEEAENNQQFLYQKIDRLTKDVSEKDEELESVSHALKEVEASYESMNKRMAARTEQIKKFAEDLMKANKELEDARAQNERLQHKNEQLVVELQVANSRKKTWKEQHSEPLPERPVTRSEQRPQPLRLEQQQQHYHVDYRPQQMTQQAATTNNNNRTELKSALHFAMADEVGEIMDSSSSFPPKLIKSGRQVAKPNMWEQPNYGQYNQDTPLDQQENVQRTTRGPPGTITKENNVKYCSNHRIKRSQLFEDQIDPIAEYKMRVERANELARRNMQTKPLHQTSYPLELDTFDTTDLSEAEIKRGNVAKQSRIPEHPPPPPPPPSKLRQQPTRQRQALANFSNTPPTRRIYPKAIAFEI